MREKFCKWLGGLLVVLVVHHLLTFISTPLAYQIDLEYYDALSKDTVTPVGIYKNVILCLDTSPEVLNKIRAVTYHLDETFYKPHVTVKSKHNKFQLGVNTLNHIPVTVDVLFKNGKSAQLNKYVLLGTRKHQLKQAYNIHLRHVVTKTPDKDRGETNYEIDLLLEGPDNDMSQVEHVEYFFSKPFPKRVVKVNSRVPQFKFNFSTSEQLNVQAYVYFKDGSVLEMIRFLYFKYY